jgi:uncharacterized membrane protein YfcA
MFHLLVFAVVNLLAAALSGAAGGGGGLISTPLLVTLGLSPSAAIATSKFGGLGISAGSSARFFREKLTSRRLVILFSIFSAVGAVLGSVGLLVLKSHEAALQDIMGFAILIFGVPMLYVRNLGLTTRQPPAWLRGVGYGLILFSVTLQAAFSTGLGAMQLVILMGCFGMTALTASATRRSMQLTVAVISLSIFIFTGLVDYKYGAVGFITSLVGGFIGTHLAVRKGNKFVINLFAVTSVLLAIQLLVR